MPKSHFRGVKNFDLFFHSECTKNSTRDLPFWSLQQQEAERSEDKEHLGHTWQLGSCCPAQLMLQLSSTLLLTLISLRAGGGRTSQLCACFPLLSSPGQALLVHRFVVLQGFGRYSLLSDRTLSANSTIHKE